MSIVQRNRRGRVALLALAVVSMPWMLAAAHGGADTRDANATPQVEPGGTPGEEDERLRAELEEIATAWRLGGGEFGFPFWEKAGQRWTAGQVTTPIYREYSTGYRDRLRAGCELLDSLDVDSEIARDVRSLVDDACSTRVEALRQQQRWLDTLIELDNPEATTQPGLEPEVAAERAAELQAVAAEHEARYREALQESYRGARLAISLAQAALDARGLERLPEGAFI